MAKKTIAYFKNHYAEIEIYNTYGYKGSLGNWTDAGWYWTLESRDNMMLLWIYRALTSSLDDLKKFIKQNESIFNHYMKHANKNMLYYLFYGLTGDNNMWYIGNFSSELQSMFEYTILYDKGLSSDEYYVDFDYSNIETVEKKVINTCVKEFLTTYDKSNISILEIPEFKTFAYDIMQDTLYHMFVEQEKYSIEKYCS